jgi:hypothetical protein
VVSTRTPHHTHKRTCCELLHLLWAGQVLQTTQVSQPLQARTTHNTHWLDAFGGLACLAFACSPNPPATSTVYTLVGCMRSVVPATGPASTAAPPCVRPGLPQAGCWGGQGGRWRTAAAAAEQTNVRAVTRHAGALAAGSDHAVQQSPVASLLLSNSTPLPPCAAGKNPRTMSTVQGPMPRTAVSSCCSSASDTPARGTNVGKGRKQCDRRHVPCLHEGRAWLPPNTGVCCGRTQQQQQLPLHALVSRPSDSHPSTKCAARSVR